MPNFKPEQVSQSNLQFVQEIFDEKNKIEIYKKVKLIKESNIINISIREGLLLIS